MRFGLVLTWGAEERREVNWRESIMAARREGAGDGGEERVGKRAEVEAMGSGGCECGRN